jgi:hypothetical protein
MTLNLLFTNSANANPILQIQVNYNISITLCTSNKYVISCAFTTKAVNLKGYDNYTRQYFETGKYIFNLPGSNLKPVIYWDPAVFQLCSVLIIIHPSKERAYYGMG